MQNPTPIIINCDPGIDDVLAIIMALNNPEKVQIKAICLSFGNTTLQNGHDNILRLFSVLQKYIEQNPAEERNEGLRKSLNGNNNKILLAKGASHPIQGLTYNSSDYHGKDGLGDISTLPDNPWPIPNCIPDPLVETQKTADEVILDILSKHDKNTVRIVSLAPLTNLTLAWQNDPETFARVGGISAMIGNLDVAGNDTPSAEFNAFADPFAFRILLQDAPKHQKTLERLPFDILPLDITNQHKVPFSQLCSDGVPDKNILQKFIAAILAHPRQRANARAPKNDEAFDMEEYDNFTAHDPLALAHVLFCPSPIERKESLTEQIDETFSNWHIKTRTFGIETDGYLTRGECVTDRRKYSNGKPFTIPTGTNTEEPFEDDGKDKSGTCLKMCKRMRHKFKCPLGRMCKGLRHKFECPLSRMIKSYKRNRETNLSSPSDQKKLRQTTAGCTASDDHKRPFTGEWDVVISSPGVDWFKDTFLKSLTL